MLEYLGGGEIAVVVALVAIPLAVIASVELMVRNKRRREMRLGTRNKEAERVRR